MARRRNEPIQTRSFVTVNGEPVEVKNLPPEKRKEVATWLKLTWMNEIYRGRAVFTVAEGEKNPT